MQMNDWCGQMSSPYAVDQLDYIQINQSLQQWPRPQWHQSQTPKCPTNSIRSPTATIGTVRWATRWATVAIAATWAILVWAAWSATMCSANECRPWHRRCRRTLSKTWPPNEFDSNLACWTANVTLLLFMRHQQNPTQARSLNRPARLPHRFHIRQLFWPDVIHVTLHSQPVWPARLSPALRSKPPAGQTHPLQFHIVQRTSTVSQRCRCLDVHARPLFPLPPSLRCTRTIVD